MDELLRWASEPKKEEEDEFNLVFIGFLILCIVIAGVFVWLMLSSYSSSKKEEEEDEEEEES